MACSAASKNYSTRRVDNGVYVCAEEAGEYKECVSLVLHQLRGFAGERFFLQPPHVTMLHRIARGKFGDIHLASTGVVHSGDSDVRASVPVVVREYQLPKLPRIAPEFSPAQSSARKASSTALSSSSSASPLRQQVSACDALAVVHSIVHELRMWLSLTSSVADSTSEAQSDSSLCVVSLFGVCYDSKEERILAYTEWCEFGDLHSMLQPQVMSNRVEREDNRASSTPTPIWQSPLSESSSPPRGVSSASSAQIGASCPQRMSLPLACTIFLQLLRSLHIFHSKLKVALGNIRLDHILVGSDERCLSKFADISSAQFVRHAMLQDQSAHAKKNDVDSETELSVLYASPELYYDEPCNAFANDVWALGICFFTLLTGNFAYPCPSVDDPRLRGLVNGKVSELFRECSCPSQLSDNVQLMDFLHNIFTQPQHRWSAEQLLRHPFMQQAAKFESSIGRQCKRANNAVMQVFQKHVLPADSPALTHNISPEALTPEKDAQNCRTQHSSSTPTAARGTKLVTQFTATVPQHCSAVQEELMAPSSARDSPLQSASCRGGMASSTATSPSPFSFPLPIRVPASASAISSPRQRSMTETDAPPPAAGTTLILPTALTPHSELTEPTTSPFASLAPSARVSASPLLHADDLDDEIAFYNQNLPSALSPPHQPISHTNTPPVALAASLSASASAVASPFAAASPLTSLLVSSSLTGWNPHTLAPAADNSSMVTHITAAASTLIHTQQLDEPTRSPLPNSLPVTAVISTAVSVTESLSVIVPTSHSTLSSLLASAAPSDGTAQQLDDQHTRAHSHNISQSPTANQSNTTHSHLRVTQSHSSAQPSQQLLGARRLLKPSSAPPPTGSALLMAVADESDPFLASPSQLNSAHSQQQQAHVQHHLRAASDHPSKLVAARSSSVQLSPWPNNTAPPASRQRSFPARGQPPLPISLTLFDVRVAAVN